MAQPQPVDPVKLFVALLWSDADARKQAVHELRLSWGVVDFSGADYLFDVTDYYRPEMGSEIYRRLITFQRLVEPEALQELKLHSNIVEDRLARNGKRCVNVDVGYLDHSKIVLGSMKHAGQKIHLGKGVYADLMGRYGNGRYQSFEWTFPDFRDGRYDDELNRIRRTYLSQLRELRSEVAAENMPTSCARRT